MFWLWWGLGFRVWGKPRCGIGLRLKGCWRLGSESLLVALQFLWLSLPPLPHQRASPAFLLPRLKLCTASCECAERTKLVVVHCSDYCTMKIVTLLVAVVATAALIATMLVAALTASATSTASAAASATAAAPPHFYICCHEFRWSLSHKPRTQNQSRVQHLISFCNLRAETDLT